MLAFQISAIKIVRPVGSLLLTWAPHLRMAFHLSATAPTQQAETAGEHLMSSSSPPCSQAKTQHFPWWCWEVGASLPSPKENETKCWHWCSLRRRSPEQFRVSSGIGRVGRGSLFMFTQEIAQIAVHVKRDKLTLESRVSAFAQRSLQIRLLWWKNNGLGSKFWRNLVVIKWR